MCVCFFHGVFCYLLGSGALELIVAVSGVGQASTPSLSHRTSGRPCYALGRGTFILQGWMT